MRDGKHRGALAKGDDVAADRRVLNGIESAGHLVQDQQLGPADQRPGQRDALALAARQPCSLGADHGLHALGQLGHELFRARPPERLLDRTLGYDRLSLKVRFSRMLA